MIYDHKVKFDGILYEAGTEVPNDAAEAQDMPFADISREESWKYSYEDLSAMTVKDIKKLAEDKGITITKIIKDEVIGELLSQQM